MVIVDNFQWDVLLALAWWIKAGVRVPPSQRLPCFARLCLYLLSFSYMYICVVVGWPFSLSGKLLSTRTCTWNSLSKENSGWASFLFGTENGEDYSRQPPCTFEPLRGQLFAAWPPWPVGPPLSDMNTIIVFSNLQQRKQEIKLSQFLTCSLLQDCSHVGLFESSDDLPNSVVHGSDHPKVGLTVTVWHVGVQLFVPSTKIE